MTAVEVSAVRRRLGLSQAAFARALGVATHTVQNWEQGLRCPRGPAVIMIEDLAKGPRRKR